MARFQVHEFEMILKRNPFDQIQVKLSWWPRCQKCELKDYIDSQDL